MTVLQDRKELRRYEQALHDIGRQVYNIQRRPGIVIPEIAPQIIEQLRAEDSTSPCYDAVVAPDGSGTHTTLAAAVADMIIEAGASGRRTIWICSDLTEGNISLNALGESAVLIIAGPERSRFTIFNTANDDIFTQTIGAGNVAGGLIFQNLTFSLSSSKAILGITTVSSSLRRLHFYYCEFAGGTPLRATAAGVTLGSIDLRIENCTTKSTLLGFYQQNNGPGPDQLRAYNNFMSMTRWWDDITFSPTTFSAPDFTHVQGGRYTITNGLDIPGAVDEQIWQNFHMIYSGAGAAFRTSATNQSNKDFKFSDIAMRYSAGTAYFCDFGSLSTNPGQGLFIKNIYAFPAGIGVSTSALSVVVVSPNWENVHVGNIFGRGGFVPPYYTGPVSAQIFETSGVSRSWAQAV